MKKLLIIFFVCFGFLAKGQVFTPMTAAGYQNKRTKTDSTNYIPTFPGFPNLRSTTAQKQAAIAADSTNKLFYWYDPKTETWNVLGSGTGSTINIFNDTTILICSGTNNCDTFITNVTANYVSIFNDSTLIVCNTEGACDTININPTVFGVSVVSFTKNAAGDSIILTLSDNTRLAVKDSLGVGISTINIITDSSISICNFNSCDTFITTVNPQLVTILNDSTLLVCDTTNTCDTLHIPRTQFIQNLFDTTNIYNQIQNVYNYFSDTSFTNQFFPRGDGVLLDTVIRITDSTLRFIYTDGTQKEDTFRIALTQENITNITNIINYIDSLRGNDTTFILSANFNGNPILRSTTDSLSGNDSLHYEYYHPDVVGDSVLTLSDDLNTDGTRDLKMKLVTSGTGGGIDSVGNPNGTDSLNDYTGGVPRLAYRDQRVWNVKDYGAVGDGVTDDTRAIQRTINAVYAAGGGKVYFPNGTYEIGDTLNITSTFSGGIRYGGSNSQLYIPDNQTPFTSHPLVSIEFVGEESPNMFTSILVPYVINHRGVILHSSITGSVTGGVYPAILGAAGDAWTYGNINDAQVSIKNINFRVKANISASGPTMSAANLYKISSIGYIENVLCNIDTASTYSVYPSAVTFGFYLPYANNSAFNPISNCIVTGYKYGYIFSEHTTGSNLDAFACEYAFLFTGGPHSQNFGRLGSFWNKYSLANGSANFAAVASPIRVHELDVETDTTTAHWWKSRYIVYDSTNAFVGDLTYYIVQSPNGANASNQFNMLGGANVLFRPRALGSYPDTTSTIGFITHNKFTTDSTTIRAAIPAQFNPIAGTDMSLTGSYPNITFNSTAALGAGAWSTIGGSIYRPTGRVGIGTSVPTAKMNVRAYGLGATIQDSLGLVLENDSAALVNAQQWSPSITWVGKGWKSDATTASRDIRFETHAVPVQATVNPTANLITSFSVNGGAYSTVSTLRSDGLLTQPSLTVNGAFTAAGTITQNNGGAISLSGVITSSETALTTTPTDFLIFSNSTNATSGVPVQNPGIIRFTGKAWDGTATKTSDWRIGMRQTSGASPITTNLAFYSQINAGGYNDSLTLSNKMKFTFPGTITAGGTTGNQTIDKPTGTVNIAAGGTAVTVTNALCTTSSIVLAVIRTNDATAQIKSVVPGAGSFVINIVASTGEVSIGFLVIN